MKMEIALVTWHDAWTESGPEDKGRIDDAPMLVTTVGFLLRDSKNGVTLAAEHLDNNRTGDGQYKHIVWIPRAAVSSMEILSLEIEDDAEVVDLRVTG